MSEKRPPAHFSIVDRLDGGAVKRAVLYHAQDFWEASQLFLAYPDKIRGRERVAYPKSTI